MSNQWKALFLDLDNCLIDRDAAFKAMLHELFDDLSEETWNEIAAVDNHAYCDRWKFSEWFIQRFPKLEIWRELSKDAELHSLTDFFYQYQIKNISCSLKPAGEKLLLLLEELSTQFELVLVSNGGSINQRSKLKNARLNRFFTEDRLFISAEYKSKKPEAAFFELILDSKKWTVEDVLMIGDDPINDIKGAGDLGIDTCWISMGRSFPLHLNAPDFCIDRFVDFKLDKKRMLCQ